MNKFILIIALPLLMTTGLGQSRNCLRVMPPDELVRSASIIARVKVYKASKAAYRGMFSQLAILRPVDVIDGDFTLKEIYVLSRSNVPCAEDNYVEAQELLVFLEPEASLFHTLSYQFGQFLIEGDIVKGWRDKTNKPLDKPYAEVRKEIQAYIDAGQNKQNEGAPQPQPPAKPIPPPNGF
jgi:hypothetical protein